MPSTSEKRENLIYLVVWLLILVVSIGSISAMLIGESIEHPLLKALVRSARAVLPYFVFFLIHNYLVAPLIVKKNKKVLYCILAAVLVGVFSLFFLKYSAIRRGIPEGKEGIGMMAPEGPRPDMGPMQDGNGPSQDGMGQAEGDGFQGNGRPDNAPPPKPEEDEHFRDFSMPPESLHIAVLILLILANLGVKYSMKQSDNKRKMEELEKENLNQQLQYLRYQINPHFFMNTLNNIHALVDIDPAEAKECILELSKLMRYILYEGSKPTIPLDKETEFLKQYISLMRIRYQDNVKIEVELPGSLPGVEIPPLLFISFVENAFKHGVSYDEDSFIKVKMEVIDDMIHFQCVNSRHAPRHANGKDTRKGIGMENVKKRLDLLYGDDYVMEVKSGEKDYGIYVVIPISYEKSSIHDKSSVHEKSEEK